MSDNAKRWIELKWYHPEMHMNQILVVDGPEGCGKSIFVSQMIAKIGCAQSEYVNPHQVTAHSFNYWAKNCLVICEEWRFKKHIERLKPYASEHIIKIDKQGKDPYDIVNRMGIIILYTGKFKINPEDRRIVRISAPEALEVLKHV